MNFQNLFSKRKILLKAFSNHMVCYIVTNNFFVSFEISGGSYNPSQNTLRLINEFEKCTLPFMESLVTDFIKFSSIIVKFLFPWDYALDNVCTLFRDFTKISSCFKSFDNSRGNSYIQFVVIMI